MRSARIIYFRLESPIQSRRVERTNAASDWSTTIQRQDSVLPFGTVRSSSEDVLCAARQ